MTVAASIQQGCVCWVAETRPSISSLWGLTGEAYQQPGPLRDWSRAGYGAGEKLISTPTRASDLMLNWSATGDGVTDDTQVAYAIFLPFDVFVSRTMRQFLETMLQFCYTHSAMSSIASVPAFCSY